MSYAALVFFDPPNLMGRINNHSLQQLFTAKSARAKGPGVLYSQPDIFRTRSIQSIVYISPSFQQCYYKQ